MNILHICSTYPPDIGGTATSVPCLAREQAQLGHNAIILTHGNPAFSVENNISIYRCGKTKNNITGISAGLKKSMMLGILGRRIIRQHNIDIIHAHDPNVSAITKLIIDPRSKIPSVVKYSGDLAWETLGLRSRKYIKDPKRFWTSKEAKTILFIEKLIFSRFDRIIAQNNYQKDMLINHVKLREDKISVIPNGIRIHRYTKKDIKIAENELPASKTRLCSAARLVPWKGIEQTIEAMKEIDADYIIFGDGPEKDRLIELARKKGVSKKVFFFGKVPNEKMQLYLGLCDLLIVPSVYEPFGIVILDGFAAKVAIIGSDTGGIPELISKNMLFCQKDVGEINEKIIYALKNKKRIIETQDKKISRYAWKEIALEMQATYRNISRKRRH